jgi:hypothetical protein
LTCPRTFSFRRQTNLSVPRLLRNTGPLPLILLLPTLSNVFNFFLAGSVRNDDLFCYVYFAMHRRPDPVVLFNLIKGPGPIGPGTGYSLRDTIAPIQSEGGRGQASKQRSADKRGSTQPFVAGVFLGYKMSQ